MGKFSTEERDKLYALFTVDEHEIREGATSKDKSKIQWFTYIRREAIIMRLDGLFFGEWESGFINNLQPYQYHQTHVDCAMHLTIRGMRREYNGSQDGGGINGAKGAATDAFKRVAAQWGIGLYLQQSPQIWTENYKSADGKADWNKKRQVEKEAMDKVAAWLRQLGATGNQLSQSEDSRDDEPQVTPPATTGNNDGKVITGQFAPQEKTWEEQVFEATAFLYDHPNHQTNSINALLRNGKIKDTDKAVVSILQIIFHKAAERYGLSPDECKEIIGSQVEGTVADYMKSPGATYQTAWGVIVASQQREQLPPTGTEGTTYPNIEIPF
jgi:hypothetical protein